MNKAKETAMKLAEQVREREEKAKNKGEELLEKLFKEDLSGNLLLDPVFEEILLQEERTILPLEKLIEKVQKRKGADSNRGKNKLRLELAKAILELQEKKAIDKIDLEIEKYQKKAEQLETEETFERFNCSTDTVTEEDLKNEPVLFKPNFLTQGEIHILAGKAGSGKSYLATQMALALATGEPLFGMYATKKQSVAYLSFEDSKARLLQRLQNMGWEGEKISLS